MRNKISKKLIGVGISVGLSAAFPACNGLDAVSGAAVIALPGQPTAFAAANVADRSIALGWTINATGTYNTIVQQCTGQSCTPSTTAATLSEGVSAYTATGLSPSTYYTFSIYSQNALGNTPATTLTVETGPAIPLTPITGTVTSTTIPISWTNVSTDQTSVAVQSCTGAGCWSTATNFTAVSGSPLAATASSYTLTGLTAGTVYSLRVQAVRATPSAGSAWLSFNDITTTAGSTAAASCASPNTRVIDYGQKSVAIASQRGLWSDIKTIPGTSSPVVAYTDSTAAASGGGKSTVMVSWWDGTKFNIESVAGDQTTNGANSAQYIRLGFTNTSKTPIIIWTDGKLQNKIAIRSAAFGTAGTWTTTILETLSGAGFGTSTIHALEMSISPNDQVGIVYTTGATNRARFIYCASSCDSPSSAAVGTNYKTMLPSGAVATDVVSTIASLTGALASGVAWCNVAGTYKPAVAFVGSAAANAVQYASCTAGALNTCLTQAGWGQFPAYTTATVLGAKLYIDSSISTQDLPNILINTGTVGIKTAQIQQLCGSTPTSVTAGSNVVTATATAGTAWATLMKDIPGATGKYHVIANDSAATNNLVYFNSATSNFLTTTWNTGGNIDSSANLLPAGGAGAGGAVLSTVSGEIYTSYGTNTATSSYPYSILMGVINDYTYASNSTSAIFYSEIVDNTGNMLWGNTGQTRNVSMANTSTNRTGVVYVDNSIATAATNTNAKLKYAYRGTTAYSGESWTINLVPDTASPMFPALAYDNNNKPWISYYDAGYFRYYLVTNSATDGSGYWTTYQFPLGANKSGTAVAPATDDTAIAMSYVGGTAYPVMIVMNSTATGQGIYAARFVPGSGQWSVVTKIDALGAAFATRLTSDFDTSGNIAIAYYDIQNTALKYNQSNSGTSWLGSSASLTSGTLGREGVSVRINPFNSKPGLSYYDRVNNTVYYNTCSAAITSLSPSCGGVGNWTQTAIDTTAGVSGITITTNEQVLNTSLTYSSTGFAYVDYLAGIAATPNPAQMILRDNTAGATFGTTQVLSNQPGASVSTGAAALNFALPGLNVSSVRNGLGQFMSAYVGPGNYLYVTSCGD